MQSGGELLDDATPLNSDSVLIFFVLFVCRGKEEGTVRLVLFAEY